MDLNLERVRANVREADTEDLLDRATVYRSSIEPQALTLIEWELDQRGVRLAEIQDHAAMRAERLVALPDGTPRRCSFCRRPAVEVRWTWHRVWGRIPAFPVGVACCAEHLPGGGR